MSPTRNAKAVPCDPDYAVGPIQAPPTATAKVAVFIAHGMGQQIPFQTVDQVAEGLRQLDRKKGNSTPQAISRTVKTDDQWLNRVELQLKTKTKAVEAHVYEAYWAPLTEGRVTIRDVIRFLAGAGRNGIRNARRGQFGRWLFGCSEKYPIPIRTLFYLVVALASIVALVVMNSTIAAVAAGRALLGERAGWLSDALLADLTTTFNVVVVAMAAFAVTLAVGMLLRKLRMPVFLRVVWGLISGAAFTITVFLVTLAGIALPLLIYGHVRGGLAAGARVWPALFSEQRVLGFDAAFGTWAWRLALGALAIGAVWWLWRLLLVTLRDLADPGGRIHTLIIAVIFGILVAAAVMLVNGLLGVFGGLAQTDTAAAIQSGLAWALLVLASAYIRQVLVQFMGDVAVYVMPYKLDAFADLRREIRDTSYKVAKGIYEMTQGAQGAAANKTYDRVIIVGHSLGSVIAYDVLNQLIREDEAASKANKVLSRTPLFVTFGSPLDKTAFIFALQGRGTSEARESLAASVQPLLQSYDYRPARWINIYSAWDLISGALGFYDLPDSSNPKAVENVRDPDATTLLIAHTEYWQNALMFETVYGAI